VVIGVAAVYTRRWRYGWVFFIPGAIAFGVGLDTDFGQLWVSIGPLQLGLYLWAQT
jgi:hypothetical protein